MNNPFYPKPQSSREQIKKLQDKLQCSEAFSTLLLNRGQDENSAPDFLSPSLANLTDATRYSGFEPAVRRILAAVEAGEKIVIYGDYDCDGLCATAILYLTLKRLSADVQYFIPDREGDGYGLSEGALSLVADEMYPDLIITVDCGVTALAEVEFVRDVLGCDVIVTDHHEPFETLPDCIVFDPKIDKGDGVYSEICGAGVALRLSEALVGKEWAFENCLELACIATIADSVPLVSDNRIIVAFGLKQLEKTKIKGLSKLIKSASNRSGIDAYGVAFRLAPRINALGRLDNATEIVSLFYENDDFILDALIDKINKLNAERQAMCDSLVADCLDALVCKNVAHKKIILIKGDDWDGGILGIACSRLTEIFSKPVIIMSKNGDGEYKGSGRSVPGVNLFELLKANESKLIKYGGHASACGLTVLAANIDSFFESFEAYCDKNLDEKLFIPQKPCDIFADTPPSIEFVREIESLQPFGVGNPNVSFVLSVDGELNFERIGGDSKHIKCKAGNDAELVWFSGDRNLEALRFNAKKILQARFAISEYQNRQYVQGLLSALYLNFDSFLDTANPNAFDEGYIKQLFKGADGISRPKKIDAQELNALLNDSLFGTLVVAYRLDTLKNFKNYINENKLDERFAYFNVGYMESVNPINRIVLAPELKANLSLYENIVFLDCPLSIEYVDIMHLSRTVRIYKFLDCAERLTLMAPSREKLGMVYKKLRFAAKDEAFFSVEKLFLKTDLAHEGMSYADVFAAFCVLFDLGVAERLRGGRLRFSTSKGRSFLESAFLGRLAELESRN